MEKKEYVRDYIWGYNRVCINRCYSRSVYKKTIDQLLKLMYTGINTKDDK